MKTYSCLFVPSHCKLVTGFIVVVLYFTGRLKQQTFIKHQETEADNMVKNEVPEVSF